MKRIYFIICLVAYQGITQPTDTLKTHILSPAEMREDFNTYRRMIEETHPGLYRYASKLEIQHQLDSLSNAFSESMPYYTFYRAIADFNGKIKCAHSYAIPMQSIDQYLIAKCKTVPFYLHGIGDQLFVIFNGSTNEEIKPGYEITSINNRSVDEIRKQIYRFGWSDAEIETAKVKYMSGAYFWMMYYLFIEQPETFNIQYKNLEGKEGEIKLPAQLPRVTMANYKKNPVNSEMLRLLKRNKLANPYRIDILKEPTNTAVLTLSAFGGRGMHDEDVAQQSTRKFMNKAMKKMQKAGTESLIIDLRYNGGGWDIIGMEILSYLVKSDQPFTYYENSFAVTDSSEFLKFTGFSPAEYAQLKDELIPQADGTFLLKHEYNANMRGYQPKTERFMGDIYFLIHELTGSAASEFAGMAKSKGLGTFVGTETFGAYQGGNGSTFIKMPLPNSGIFVNSPLVSGYQELKPQSVPNRGVLPDHEVDFTRDDLLVRYDRQLEYVKDLIKAKKQ